jgi:hypothetical protein
MFWSISGEMPPSFWALRGRPINELAEMAKIRQNLFLIEQNE